MISEYVIVEQPADAGVGYQPYGGSRELWRCKAQEVVIAGPAETGKTLSALHKLDALAWKYPGMRGAIIRKTYQSAIQSVIVTYEKKVLGAWDQESRSYRAELTPVRKYGGERPDWYDYPNGSRIVVGGMDKAGKVLSSEYDVIYVNQAEELELEDWETLSTRCTGRAGNMPYAQLMGDCNPADPRHWILARRDEGKLVFIESRHEDNPTLFDPVTGEITEQGRRTMAVLDALTGVRKERLRYGRWVQAEGIVYEEFDRRRHVLSRSEFDAARVRYYVAGVDWGYTNPGALVVCGVDGDGRLYVVHEVYRTRMTMDWWIEQAKDAQRRFKIRVFVCDPSEPEHIEKFRRAGLRALAGYNRIMPGILAVKERLASAGDERPRLYWLEDALVLPDPGLRAEKRPVSSLDEISVYVWNDKTRKDEPVKENDHGLDALRYVVAYVDKIGTEPTQPAVFAHGSARSGWFGGR